jgi:hypothetical protein
MSISKVFGVEKEDYGTSVTGNKGIETVIAPTVKK